MRIVLLIGLIFIPSIAIGQATLNALITWDEPTHYEDGGAIDPIDIAGYFVQYEIIGAGETIQDVIPIEGNQIETLIKMSNLIYGAEYTVRSRVMSNTILGAKSEWSDWAQTTIVANGVIKIMAPPGMIISCEPSCVIQEK